MKPIKKLYIAGEPANLVVEDVRLALRQPGRAAFTINSAAAVGDLVVFDIGYHPAAIRYFIGYVETIHQANSAQKIVNCRELAGALDKIIAVRLRKTTLRDVLRVVSEATGLVFRVPANGYDVAMVPHFFHAGGGFHLMNSLGDVFGIPDYIWQQQGNGEIFVGSWADSYWSGKPVSVPDNILEGAVSAGAARVAMLPRLRPGVFITERGYLTALQLINGVMVLTCEKQLKK